MTFAPYKKIGEGTSDAFQREATKHQKKHVLVLNEVSKSQVFQLKPTY